jgi:hypothetical protein
MINTYNPGGKARNRNCPPSLVTRAASPPISAGELTRTLAPCTTPPCASLTVPMSAPDNPCAAIAEGKNTQTAAANHMLICTSLFLSMQATSLKGVIAVQKGASVHLFAWFSRFLDQGNNSR